MQNIVFTLIDEHKTIDMLIAMLQLVYNRFEDDIPLNILDIEVQKDEEGEFSFCLKLDGKLKESPWKEVNLKENDEL